MKAFESSNDISMLALQLWTNLVS